MKLALDIADVEIDMGYMCNVRTTVRLTFRRPPDITIVREIMRLRDNYGWNIERATEALASKMLISDFKITCTGASSDAVGNAIGEKLTDDHGLKVIYSQFVCLSPERSRWTQGVERLEFSK